MTDHPPEETSSQSHGLHAGKPTGEELQEILRHFDARVFGFFLRRGLSREDAQDLTQETLFRVFRNLGSFRGQGSLDGWVTSVARNVWRNWLRDRNRLKRSGREVSLEVLLEESKRAPEAASTSAEELVDDYLENERRLRLRDALWELPAEMRDCTLLRLDQGLKYAEIARVMKIPLERVKAQLHQARERLRVRLADQT